MILRPQRAAIATLAGLMACLMLPSAGASPTYIATAIGTLNGQGLAISNNGQIAGQAVVDGHDHAFLYFGGVMRDLGTLGGTESFGYGVNASGQVTGYAYLSNGTAHAFLYSGGAMTDLGSLGGNIYDSYGFGINDKGDVTGSSVHTDFQYAPPDAFIYSGGVMNSIPGAAGVGINASGQVAGYFASFNTAPHAFLYSNGVSTLIGNSSGVAGAINASGEATGWIDVTGADNVYKQHAYRYSSGTVTDLGSLGGNYSSGSGINAGGQIVGSSYLAGDQTSRAFLYSGGVMYDLNALVVGLGDATLIEATAINDSGQIVANSCCHAYRVDPVAGPPIIAAIEFYNAALDHYFFTHIASEVAILDAGITIKGWVRTGQSFNVYPLAQANASPVCRFYIPPDKGDSHFVGRGIVECNATAQQNPSFILEDPAFLYMHLPVSGVCPASTTEVFRVFDNRPDANHRYMTDKSVRDAMVAKGWLVEGDGPDHVVMCAPQ